MSRHRSIKEKIERCESRIESREYDISKGKEDLSVAVASIRAARLALNAEHQILAALKAQVLQVKNSGLKRNVLKANGLSPIRHIRFRQLVEREYARAGIECPEVIMEISEADVGSLRTTALIDIYVIGEGSLSSLIGLSETPAAIGRIRASMREMTATTLPSEKPESLWHVHPEWNREEALTIAISARQEFAVGGDLAIDVGQRNAMVSSNWLPARIDGVWMDDVAAAVAARFSPSERQEEIRDANAGKAIDLSVNGSRSKSLSAIENDMRLMEAVAIFATPGAVAQGVAYGLHEVGRKFANAWFGANRSLISRHYPRVGSAAAFRDVVADPEKFREVHASGAAPKIAQSSRFWGREASETELFEKMSPRELVEVARHNLIDTSLRSPLVSMPKKKDDFVDLGSWQGNEAFHADVFGIGAIVSKGFLAGARDAAEIQVMQGVNPIAATIGLVTWISADGVRREAPLFLAMSSFDAETNTVSRLSSFNLNTAWLRRLAVEYPQLASLEIVTEFPLGDKPGDVFASIAAKINAAGDAKPIVSIADHCFVGVFDSSRSVLERRLNLGSFPDLVENPIVGMLAQGAKHPISYAEYTPQVARSRPDRVQTLAVRASLGGGSFILEGPPGTGKTQTIFEMVRALEAAGKRVLISAAMPGAIEVIGRRLRGVVTFVLCALRPGQIDIGAKSSQGDVRDTKYQVVIGTPLALTARLRADDKFDVLIIDESSQLRLSHALSLAGHASQLVVVGDSKQLQPRDSESGDVTEMSLLMRARMAGLPAIVLEEHYRSQHASLIAWSNLYSYDSKLQPRSGTLTYGDAGFCVVYVAPGRRVQRDLAHVNVEEADRIADECLKWARDGRRSVGVAAMTQAQRDLIRETVEQRLKDAGISAAAAGENNRFFAKTEPFFVRTAGAVQGEERDVLLISLGVAPDKNGRISQRIGVLSRNDSLALCNVMMSRSRLITAVYSSIVPADIDLSTMTPSMFLVASILRMGAVVSALEMSADRRAVIDLKTVDPKFEWNIDSLQMDGETFYAVRTHEDAENYAFAIVSRQPSAMTPLAQKLESGGWIVFGCMPENFAKPSEIIRRARDKISLLPALR